MTFASDEGRFGVWQGRARWRLLHWSSGLFVLCIVFPKVGCVSVCVYERLAMTAAPWYHIFFVCVGGGGLLSYLSVSGSIRFFHVRIYTCFKKGFQFSQKLPDSFVFRRVQERVRAERRSPARPP